MDFESFEFRDSEWVWKKEKKSGYDPHFLSLEWWEVCEWIGLFVDVDRRQMSSSDETAFDFSLCFPLSLSLSHSFSQLSAISICLSVSLSFPFVCLSISVSVSLSSNLRLDLLNPHTVHLTYTFIRIKTRW